MQEPLINTQLLSHLNALVFHYNKLLYVRVPVCYVYYLRNDVPSLRPGQSQTVTLTHVPKSVPGAVKQNVQLPQWLCIIIIHSHCSDYTYILTFMGIHCSAVSTGTVG